MGHHPELDRMHQTEKLIHTGQDSVTHVLTHECYLCPDCAFLDSRACPSLAIPSPAPPDTHRRTSDNLSEVRRCVSGGDTVQCRRHRTGKGKYHWHSNFRVWVA